MNDLLRRVEISCADEHRVLDADGAGVEHHPQRHAPLVAARRGLGRVEIAVRVEPDERETVEARGQALDRADVRAAAAAEHERSLGKRRRHRELLLAEARLLDDRHLRVHEVERRAPPPSRLHRPPRPAARARGRRRTRARRRGTRSQGPSRPRCTSCSTGTWRGAGSRELLLERHVLALDMHARRARRAASRPVGFSESTPRLARSNAAGRGTRGTRGEGAPRPSPRRRHGLRDAERRRRSRLRAARRSEHRRRSRSPSRTTNQRLWSSSFRISHHSSNGSRGSPTRRRRPPSWRRGTRARPPLGTPRGPGRRAARAPAAPHRARSPSTQWRRAS